MAGASLLTLLDDISTVLDDIAVMSKVAAKKTSAVLGDDLALNAQQVSGVAAEREIPVVLAVAKGSLINKAILVPLALLFSAFIPWIIIPLLMIGGLYLCYEGSEKVIEKLFHLEHDADDEGGELASTSIAEYEKRKVKGAIRTDFVLSAEITTIALGTVQHMPMLSQVFVLTIIAITMTFGVYGLVGGIVKLDDLGMYLEKRSGGHGAMNAIGQSLIAFAPKLMKILTVVGTLAMFLVGGGIVVEHIHVLHHFIASMASLAPESLVSSMAYVLNGVFGLIAGAVLVLLVLLAKKVVPEQA